MPIIKQRWLETDGTAIDKVSEVKSEYYLISISTSFFFLNRKTERTQCARAK